MVNKDIKYDGVYKDNIGNSWLDLFWSIFIFPIQAKDRCKFFSLVYSICPAIDKKL